MTARKRKPGRPALPAKKRATETLSIRLYRDDMATLRELTSTGGSASEVVRAGLEALPRLLLCTHVAQAQVSRVDTAHGAQRIRCVACGAEREGREWVLPARLQALRDSIAATADDV